MKDFAGFSAFLALSFSAAYAQPSYVGATSAVSATRRLLTSGRAQSTILRSENSQKKIAKKIVKSIGEKRKKSATCAACHYTVVQKGKS